MTTTFSPKKRHEARMRVVRERRKEVRERAHMQQQRQSALLLREVEDPPEEYEEAVWDEVETEGDAGWLEDEEHLAHLYTQSEAEVFEGEGASKQVLCPLCRVRLVACTRTMVVTRRDSSSEGSESGQQLLMDTGSHGSSHSAMDEGGPSAKPSLDDELMTEDNVVFDESAMIAPGSSSVVNPVVSSKTERKPGARFSCPCGFRLDVPGGEEVDLTLLDSCLRSCVREHAGLGCAGEPTFEVRPFFGTPMLFMDCFSCGYSFHVL